MPSRSAAAWGGSPLPPLAGLDGRYVDRVNTIPFVSVVFVLLVIMFVITPVSGYSLYFVPSALTAEVVPRRHDVLVVQGGQIYLTGHRVDRAGLPASVSSLLRGAGGTPTLYVAADRDASWPEVLDAIGAAQAAGVRRVELLASRPMHAPMLAPRAGVVRWADRNGCQPWLAERVRRECR